MKIQGKLFIWLSVFMLAMAVTYGVWSKEPVGTTALRLIESASMAPREVAPFAGHTDIFIRPGFVFRATSALLTNFHLPRSTLLMLVSALMGVDRIRQVYAHAIAERYRFFSYGDSSLLLPGG